MGAYAYMLRCSDKSLYVGSATGDDLWKRIAEHQLVWSEHFDRITDAIAVERKLKGWSRKKKESLIRNEWGAIKAFAKRRAGKRMQ